MNIDDAKKIPLVQILEILGHRPTKQNGKDAWYLSPLRREKTASFHVNIPNNLWYDFGDSAGGSTIDFVCAHLKTTHENHTVSDALRWLRNMTGYTPMIVSVPSVDYSLEDTKLELKDRRKLEHRALINYLKQRGIPSSIGRQYLSELRIRSKKTGKTFFALGLQNEEGGYEFRNPYLKGCVGTKGISFIRGTKPKPEGIHIFEGMMDHLSVIASQYPAGMVDDAIILNSLSCLKMATPYIHNYGYQVAYTWMDNDTSGTKALKALGEYFKTQHGLIHKSMNDLCKPHKDVNAWHTYKLGLSE